MPVKVSQTYKPTVRLTTHRGHYRVQSGTDPHTWYETTANSCTCPARKPCKHQKFVRSLNVSFYVTKEAEAPVVVPMSAGAPSGLVRPVQGNPTAGVDAQIDAAEARLAQARRALQDTDLRDDSYAVLWRQVDTLEREVAALHYSAMRAA